jgi:hypothetical protein
VDAAAASQRLGTVRLEPQRPIIAGEVGQWTIRLVVGSYGVDEGGTIKLAWRFASDWERPQFHDPKARAYTTVTTTGEARLEVRFDPKGHVRPWMRCVVIDVYDGSLAPGDEVQIVLGDRRDGSPGIRAQSFIEARHELRVLVDPTNACLVRPLPTSPVVSVVAGPPERLVVIIPTRVGAGEAAAIFVKGEDRWGNPTPPPEGVALAWDGEGTATLAAGRLALAAGACGRVVARWRGETFTSNPVRGVGASEPERAFWADLHAQSDATVGTGTEAEYFAFGRDVARLDVMSHQGNDFQMTDADWSRLGDAVRRFHAEGHFVVFPGFEWSANSPAGGDRNVIYRAQGRPILRSSHWQVDDPEDARSPAHPASELFARLRREVGEREVLVAAHCGGRYADIRRFHDEGLERLVEVVSCWGVFEWLLWDAFDSGYHVGVMGNSDGHKGRPGAEGPGAGQFGIAGGLTCIHADALTRDAIFDALWRRRTVATTGARIDVVAEIGGRPPGEELDWGSPRVPVRARVWGTGPLEAVIVHRGREPVASIRPSDFIALEDSRRLRVCWGGARMRGRGRRAVWDGTITVEGAVIVGATPFSFDSPADRIEAFDARSLQFTSRTTGDLDGVDLVFDRPPRAGRLRFASPVGDLDVDLSHLSAEPIRRDLGGLDLHVQVARYPEAPRTRELEVAIDVELPPDTATPIFVKVVQVDGAMAWTSPVYVRR